MVFHKNPLIVRNVQFLKKLKERTLTLPTRGKGKKEKKKLPVEVSSSIIWLAQD